MRRIRLSQQIVRFAGVGLLSTAVHLGLFAALVHGGAPAQLSNAGALVIATLLNTALNRAWTFGVTGRRRLVAQHGQALVVFAITYAATTAGLAVLGVLVPDAGTGAKTLVVAAANLLSTAARFVAMRRWIFPVPADAAAPSFGGPTDRHEPAYVIDSVPEAPQGDR